MQMNDLEQHSHAMIELVVEAVHAEDDPADSSLLLLFATTYAHLCSPMHTVDDCRRMRTYADVC
jgi:hypothetical protein